MLISVNTKEDVGFTRLTKRPQVKSLAKHSVFSVFFTGVIFILQGSDVLHLGLWRLHSACDQQMSYLNYTQS